MIKNLFRFDIRKISCIRFRFRFKLGGSVKNVTKLCESCLQANLNRQIIDTVLMIALLLIDFVRNTLDSSYINSFWIFTFKYLNP